MGKRFADATAILFAVAMIMATSTFNGILRPAVVAQTQPINSISSSQGNNSSNPFISQHYIQTNRECCGTDNKQDTNNFQFFKSVIIKY
jgi:hypothetical protein